jgi:hypothetical protein
VKRILTSRDSNILRIGSLQSFIGIPSADVIFIAAASDGLSRIAERVGRESEARDMGGSSKHHRLGILWMASSTMLSPSSLPLTSEKVLEREENNDIKGMDL